MRLFIYLFMGCISYQPINAQELQVIIGGNYNETLQKEIPNNPNVQLKGFEANNGYQVGLCYRHNIAKKIYAGGEVGFIQKGHQNKIAVPPYHKTYYRNVYLRSTIGYLFPFGFSAELGCSLGLKPSSNHQLSIEKVSPTEFAFAPALRWQYQKWGLSMGYHQGITPIEKVDLLGLMIHHRHRAFLLNASYKLF